MIYKNRIIKLPDKSSFFLIGVRGSGKTALLKRLFPEALYLDLLNERLYQSYLYDISQFYKTVNNFKKNAWVIVDEIQKMPQLLNEVHRLIEESSRQIMQANENQFDKVKNLIQPLSRRFILTGSSVYKLKKPGVNLLAGRAGMINLHPFVPEELEEDFNLNMALQYGLLPVVWSAPDKQLALQAYGYTYLKEEIKAEALVRNLPGFTRFLEVAALYHGQLVNMSAISRECQISRDAVRSFFSILEDTNLGFFLPAHTSKLQLREKKHPKFYLTDPGLVRSLKNNFGPVSIDEKGFLFEGLVAQILRAYKDYRSLYDSMFYWSPANAKQTEVDFLLKKGHELTAIEIKSKTYISSQDYKGLKVIKELPNVIRRIIVYLGDEPQKTKEGVEIRPFHSFCKILEEGNLF